MFQHNTVGADRPAFLILQLKIKYFPGIESVRLLEKSLVSRARFLFKMIDFQCRYGFAGLILRLSRILLSLLMLLLAFDLGYLARDYNLAFSGAELLWALIQAIDMDCGNVPEIGLLIHICLDMFMASISLGMILTQYFHPGGSKIWVILIWGSLSFVNVLLAYRTVKRYSKIRRSRRGSKLVIMFKASGEPVAVALRPGSTINLTSLRTE
ncbi:hypothetical protein F4774DRAFT_113604 [Daldinia eschscholtzii]|nr:hypothetical protein F4774DRAFT_113604 [Daldinia eschscholtzii]